MSGRVSNVAFTYQAVGEYAAIECVGQYLLAAYLINSYFAPRREEIGVLVDFGCGAGKSTRAVAVSVRKGGRIIGVDVAASFLEEARVLTNAKAVAEWLTVHLPATAHVLHGATVLQLLRALQSDCEETARLRWLAGLYRCLDRLPWGGHTYEFAGIDLQQDEERIHLGDQVADAVTSTIVLQECATEQLLRSALRETARIAKDGAWLAIACVSDRITCEDYTAFTYAPFPDNASRTDGVRRCRSTVSQIVWENDRHWSREVLLDALADAGWTDLDASYPLAPVELDPFPGQIARWKDEATSAPLLLLTGRRGTRSIS